MTWIADLEDERRRLTELIETRMDDDSPSVQLGLQSLKNRLAEVVKTLEDAARPRLRLKLTGAAVHNHEIDVNALAPILGELQETISSIGQALRGTATTFSSIPTDIRLETAMSVEAFEPGSVVISLRTAPDPRATTPTLAEKLDDRSQPLGVAAMDRLIQLARIARSDDVNDDALIDDVFPLGARTYLHLSKLVKTLVDTETEADLSALSPIEGERHAFLGLPAARRINDVLRRTNVAVERQDYVGELRGVSSVRNAFELLLPEGKLIVGKVREDLVPQLRQWYEKRVLATFDITITRSLTTGAESQRFLLIGLADASADSPGEQFIQTG